VPSSPQAFNIFLLCMPTSPCRQLLAVARR
jgi:hypothetical protein